MSQPIANPIRRFDGSSVGWSLYVEDYDRAVEAVAESIANANGFTVVQRNAPGMKFRRAAVAALEAIGITISKSK